jgi:putative sterol carrier protein
VTDNRVHATEAFFERVAKTDHEPLLARIKGTLRFDLDESGRTEHWFVSVDRGRVLVSHRNAAADAVLEADRSMFEQVVDGRVNAMAAVLRGAIVPKGDLGLLISFGRLFRSQMTSAQEPPQNQKEKARTRR